MKKRLFISILVMLSLLQAVAQEQEYTPFVREGVKWVCYDERPYFNRPPHYFTLEFRGEKEIGGKVYMAMHKYSGDDIDCENDTIPVYMREEDRVVYAIVPDGKTYAGYPVGIEVNTAMMEKIAAGEEFVWLDFKDPVTFIENTATLLPYGICKIIPDEIMVSGKKTKRYIFRHTSYDICMIEGIGFDGRCYPINIADHQFGNDLRLSYVIENGEVIYKAQNYISEEEIAMYDWTHQEWMEWMEETENSIPYLVQEGVQWVNEHVIVEHGDTTRLYYSYEFKGKDSRNWALLYGYTGDTLNTTDATIVAKAQDCGNYDTRGSNIPLWGNLPLQKTVEEGRNLVYQDQGLRLYSTMTPGDTYDISFYYTPNFYIYNQARELFLTRENLVEIEPLEIDGYTCTRFAYIDEQGEPLAYIVDGIGFDSRDMGDLLTPFTKRPDPDAEYQEWWGLSHVVKDGNIIYKGMCYDPTKFENLWGDVNGDGKVNITDVTILISMLIGNNTPVLHSSANGDVNSDGYVNITDVTTLINYVLTR